jgi:hypothetical protein
MSALPNKYVPVSYSLLGISSYLTEALRPNDTVSTLWDRVRSDERVRTFDRYADALALLFAGSILELDRGILRLVPRREATK